MLWDAIELVRHLPVAAYGTASRYNAASLVTEDMTVLLAFRCEERATSRHIGTDVLIVTLRSGVGGGFRSRSI